MAVTLISYATSNFFQSQKKLVISAKRFGIDNVLSFNNLWLHLYNRPFIKKNKNHFRFKRGGGFWVWKPYIILKALEKMKQGEYLIYLDAGIEIIEPIDTLLKICDENNGILLFSTFYFTNRQWTKRDVFVQMGCDTEEHWNSNQVEAGMLVLKKSHLSKEFINEWLSWCENLELVSDLPNTCGLPNLTGFIAHRWDQAILSLIASTYRLELYRSPHQFTNNLKMPKFRSLGEYLDNNLLIPEHKRGCYAHDEEIIKNSPYGTIFNHHRQRNWRSISLLPKILSSFWHDANQTQKWLKNPSSSA